MNIKAHDVFATSHDRCVRYFGYRGSAVSLCHRHKIHNRQLAKEVVATQDAGHDTAQQA